MRNNKKLGVVIAVDGLEAQIGMYNLTNDDVILWNGEMVVGTKIGAYLSINQNGIKIIASVTEEKVIDQQNTVRSTEFDNRYSKNSINRIVKLKTKGVIENDRFFITSQYVPMIGNEVTTISSKEMNIIYSQYNENNSIKIGESILEKYPIKIDINRFFASHIGIFGNTGSGKSNTLHKVYLELFRTKFYNKLKNNSQFFVIDFNGEYISKNSFGIERGKEKKIYNINTKDNKGDKLPILEKYLFDADILSILFDASPATQVPFLRKAIKKWNSKKNEKNMGEFVVGTIKKILTTGNSVNSDAKDNWINVAKNYVQKELFIQLESLEYYSTTDAYKINGEFINDKSYISEEKIRILKLELITKELNDKFYELDKLEQLKFFLLFQKVHQSSWKTTNIEHINPLFNRIESAFNSLSKVISVIDDNDRAASKNYKTLNIISLVHANQEIRRLIPMLFSKMAYDEQKKNVAGKEIKTTKHLIIDEAHNILNSTFRNIGDDWQDYRLSVFEEIIKEGRKFGFFLTLASQRPADISPTILSQVHNYIIHRLVNEKDLRMLENTMPTLDKNSYRMIPCLGQGEAIITGNSISVPIFVKIDKEDKLHPTSEDVILTDIWK